LSGPEIGQVIRKNRPRFTSCYEKALGTDPTLKGKIVLDFVIGRTGTVTDASVQDTTIHSARVESCVVQVARSLSFPKPRGRGDVKVSYPFVFKP
jgi:TonB family protein